MYTETSTGEILMHVPSSFLRMKKKTTMEIVSKYSSNSFSTENKQSMQLFIQNNGTFKPNDSRDKLCSINIYRS